MKKKEYNERIVDYRRAFIEYLGPRCVSCGEENINILLLHHLNFVPPDFQVICKPCHQRLHRDDFLKGGKVENRNFKNEFYPKWSKSLMIFIKNDINTIYELSNKIECSIVNTKRILDSLIDMNVIYENNFKFFLTDKGLKMVK